MNQPFGLYVSIDSPLHRLNPLTKLTGLGCAIAMSFLTAGFGWATAVLLVIVPLAGLGRVARRLLRAVLVAIAPLAIFLFGVHGFFYPGGITPLLHLGPFTLTQEGVAFAYLILSRLTVLTSAGLLFLLTTPPAEVMADLAQRGLSPTLIYLLVSTLQLFPELQAKAGTILAAQRARGLETSGNLIQRSRALLPLVVPLVLGALVDVEERAMALEARAFRAKCRKTCLLRVADTTAERLLRRGLLVSTVVTIAWEQWHSWTSLT